MDANDVNMVAVGLENVGAQDFVVGNFFDGEVYIDEQKKTYQDLGYRRFNIITIFKALFSRISRAAIAEGKSRHVAGNLAGDGLQNGGMLIVSKFGTRVLLNHHEQVPGDHVTNEEILRILGLTLAPPTDTNLSERQQKLEELPNCEEACGIPDQ